MESSLLFTWRCADADELDFSCQGQGIVQVMYWTLALHQFLLLLLDTKELKPSRCRIVTCLHHWHDWSSPRLALTHILSITVWKKLITPDYHCLVLINNWVITTDHYKLLPTNVNYAMTHYPLAFPLSPFFLPLGAMWISLLLLKIKMYTRLPHAEMNLEKHMNAKAE